jgi:O-glycosyl hydrolase
MYRNYDGAGSAFGDTSIGVSNSSTSTTSAYASLSSAAPANVVVVVINKTGGPLKAAITLRHPTALTAADVYTLTSASAAPQKAPALAAAAANAFVYTMPAMSASTLVFHP